jgi:uncharacterized protein (TIGR02145 family)
MKVNYKFLLLYLIACVNSLSIFAQKVTNITAEQEGQTIQVSYNLETESPCAISLFYSTNNGIIWYGPLKKVSGDLGEKVNSGNKKITWDVLNEMEQLKFDAVVFKVDARKIGLKEIKIGNQIWSAENLNTDRFANGEIIPEAKSNEAWLMAGENQQAAWCYYNNDSALSNIYGKLYNWYSVADTNRLCPSGWHLPSDVEWSELENYLGGRSVAGGKMKEFGLTHWLVPNLGASNSSGFSGLPNGMRTNNGTWFFKGDYGYWWSLSQFSANNAFSRYLFRNAKYVGRYSDNKCYGFSVRCIKD